MFVLRVNRDVAPVQFMWSARGGVNFMGLRGPAPKPTSIKIQEGNPGKQRLNENEPEFEARIPKCPAHLDKVAKKRWRELAPMLFKARVLTEADQTALANLCQVYSTHASAQKMLNESSILIKTQSGYLQVNPLHSVIMQCIEAENKLCREFGLTPSSRSRST